MTCATHLPGDLALCILDADADGDHRRQRHHDVPHGVCRGPHVADEGIEKAPGGVVARPLLGQRLALLRGWAAWVWGFRWCLRSKGHPSPLPCPPCLAAPPPPSPLRSREYFGLLAHTLSCVKRTFACCSCSHCLMVLAGCRTPMSCASAPCMPAERERRTVSSGRCHLAGSVIQFVYTVTSAMINSLKWQKLLLGVISSGPSSS